MAKIYTRAGDAGETGLLGGARVGKDATRVAVCGAVDELNSALGVARAEGLPPGDDPIVVTIQNQLFALGEALADPRLNVPTPARIGDRQVQWLEQTIDQKQSALAPLAEFILPGGSKPGAALHLARSVCRRAERLVVRLVRETSADAAPIKYLNRLSDLLFVLARAANRAAGHPDLPWQKDQ